MPIGPAPSRAELPRHRTHHRGLPADRRRGGASRLRLPVRERSASREALATAGITFIGPNVDAIAGMGDKIASQEAGARRRGVNTVPGYTDVIRDADARRRRSRKKIGYPVMIKASAGGGGKGMRVARDGRSSAARGSRAPERGAEQRSATIASSSRSSSRSRATSRSRCSATRTATSSTSGERECSIQRRHQKVIEEAPSPFLDDEDAACDGQAGGRAREGREATARAGTVEFVVDADRSFYFLEMNTRLQVEHPVTEMITGLDLVELMIRVAAGREAAVLAGRDRPARAGRSRRASTPRTRRGTSCLRPGG